MCDGHRDQAGPGDLDRLERGLASLPAKDFETRKAWARWAERRAKDFKDNALLDRARAIEGDALRIESEMKRLGVDAPREWLAMAQDARRREVPEPEPSALGHRALKAKLAAATTAADLKAVIEEIKAFFPEAADRSGVGAINLARVGRPLRRRSRRRRTARLRPGAQGTRSPALGRRHRATARARGLPRPAVGPRARPSRRRRRSPKSRHCQRELLEKATRLARQDLGSLRLSEVKALAAVYRDKLQQPEEALQVLGDWLKIQRDRLSATDAEGPLELANLYEELLQDRVTAVELLRKAWRIDPSSKEIAEAFRSRGFRKVNDDWVESASAPPQIVGRTRRHPIITASRSRPRGCAASRPTKFARAWAANPTA